MKLVELKTDKTELQESILDSVRELLKTAEAKEITDLVVIYRTSSGDLKSSRITDSPVYMIGMLQTVLHYVTDKWLSS